LIFIEQKDGKWGVGPCDEDGDIGVVDAAPDLFGLGLPAHPVIEGATGEKGHSGQGKYAKGDPTAELVRQRHKHEPGDQGDWAHNEVDQAAQPRFICLDGLGKSLGHLTSLRTYRQKGSSACRGSLKGEQVYKYPVLTLWPRARYLSPLLL